MKQSSVFVQTPQIIGREGELERLEQLATASGTVWVFLTGRGGVGKTRMLQEIHRRVQEHPGLLAPAALIDLYHTALHSRVGFAQGVVRAFQGTGVSLERTQQAIAGYFQARARGGAVAQAEEKVGTTLLEELNHLARNRRLVLFLDTLERLVFPPLTEGEEPLLAPEFWEWLQGDFLARLQNTTVFLGGRPGARRLLAPPEEITFEEVELRGFTQEEVRAYTEAVARPILEAENPEHLQRILEQDVPHVYHLLKETDDQGREWGVRPIYLALALDYYLRRGVWPFPRDPEEAAHLSLRQVEQYLIEALREEVEERLGEQGLLEQLSWLRKGMDAELLAALREMDVPEAQGLLAQLRAQRYVFIKVRSEDQRVFLHDEVYDMMRRHLLETDPVEPTDLWERIWRHYRERIQFLQEEIRGAFSPEEETFTPEIFQKLSELQNRLQSAQLELLHYAFTLGRPLQDGLIRYQNLRESASFTGDLNFAHLVRAEAAQTLWQEESYGRVEAREHEDERVRERWQQRLRDLQNVREVLKVEAQAFWVAEKWAREEFAEAVERALQALTPPARLETPLDHTRYLFWALTQIRRAFMQLFAQSPKEAQKEIKNLADQLEEHRSTLEDTPWRFNRWFLRVVEGFLWHYQGNIAREQGLLYQALEHYKKALPRWRAVDLPYHQAATLNALGWVQATLGSPSDARAWVRDALQLRQRLGLQGPLALSLNTLAVLEYRDEHYEGALRLAKQAERIARFLNFDRARGLALHAQAMALRLQAAPEHEPKSKRRQQLLEEALVQVEQALTLVPPNNPVIWDMRHTRLQILRDVARLSDDWTSFEKELDAFEEEARQHAPLWTLAAGVTRLWARVYQWRRKDNVIDEQLGEELHKEFGQFLESLRENAQVARFLLDPEHMPVFHAASTPVLILEQLARFYAAWGMLLRELAMSGSPQRRGKRLREAAIRWTLSMEYNVAISLEGRFWGYRRAAELIYSFVQGLGIENLLYLYQGCREAWEKHLPQDRQKYARPENLTFWKFLEERLGPEDELRKSRW